jgi:thiol-disulfide isomerase/thioredoxin
LKAASSAKSAKWVRARTLFVALIAGLLFPISAHGRSANSSLVGQPAPEFVRSAFSGQSIDLAHLRGKVVLLNFWATWCAPCKLEMPIFATWQHKYNPRGLQVVGFSMDDSPAPARRLVEHLKLDYPMAMGDLRLAERYGGVLGLPLTFLIDRQGIVRARFQGEIDEKTIERRLTDLLAQH